MTFSLLTVVEYLFARVYSNTGPVYLQYCQKLAIRMYEIDADRDIHEFVLAHEDLTYSQSTNLDHLQVTHCSFQNLQCMFLLY